MNTYVKLNSMMASKNKNLQWEGPLLSFFECLFWKTVCSNRYQTRRNYCSRAGRPTGYGRGGRQDGGENFLSPQFCFAHSRVTCHLVRFRELNPALAIDVFKIYLCGLTSLHVSARLGSDAEGVGSEHLDLDGVAAVEVLHAEHLGEGHVVALLEAVPRLIL